MIKKLVVMVMLIVSIAILCSCHTTHGVGKDIESVGESIQKATE
jgi:predicted small secreted protein